MIKSNLYNYNDQTPKNQRDFNLFNSMDIENFQLFGVATSYYRIKGLQDNFDSVYRDLISSKDFYEPIQVRAFFKVDEATEHGMSEIGVGQVAERQGNVWFNISMIDHELGRVPEIGDVVENLQIAQMFEIYKISKETHRLGRPLRYNCSVRLYQSTR